MRTRRHEAQLKWLLLNVVFLRKNFETKKGYVAIGVRKRPSPVTFAILPLTLVYIAIGVLLRPSTVSFAILPLTLVHAAVGRRTHGVTK